MIGFADKNMIPALKNIWMTCFGDPLAYTDFLFDRLLRLNWVLVAKDAHKTPVSMLCMQPFTLVTSKGQLRGAYIFGVATHPEARGKGHSSALLEASERHLAREGIALSALVPAGERLFDFYAKRGYSTAFSIVKATYLAAQIPPGQHTCVLLPGNLDQLEELRNQTYGQRAMFVRWERQYLAFIDAECRLLGGEIVRIACLDAVGYAVCYRNGNVVTIKELAMPAERMPDVLAALHARYQAAAYHVYLPANQAENGYKVLPFAMIQWYDNNMKTSLGSIPADATWIAHVLD